MITSNFGKTALLRNIPIRVEEGKLAMVFTLPKLSHMLDIKDYDKFGGFIAAPLVELQKKLPIKGESKLELLLAMAKLKELTELSLLILRFLHTYIKDLEYVDDGIKVDGQPLTPPVFDFFCLCIGIASGYIDYKQFTEQQTNIDKPPKTPEELEFERKQAEADAKIRRLKGKEGKDLDSDIAHMATVVAYEFKYELDYVFGLNIYAVNQLYRTCWIASSDRIEVVAFGSGNKDKKAKYKYFKEV